MRIPSSTLHHNTAPQHRPPPLHVATSRHVHVARATPGLCSPLTQDTIPHAPPHPLPSAHQYIPTTRDMLQVTAHMHSPCHSLLGAQP